MPGELGILAPIFGRVGGTAVSLLTGTTGGIEPRACAGGWAVAPNCSGVGVGAEGAALAVVLLAALCPEDAGALMDGALSA